MPREVPLSSDRVQSVRNAWTNAVRGEVLRSDIPELPRIVAVGVWIATYADADGSNAYPSRETLARLTGSAPETVTRAVKVLIAVGLLARKRRPNASAVYQLIIPMGRPDWAAHVHLYTDNRQRRARAKQKAEETAAAIEERTASADAIREASPADVPDSVPGHLPEGSDSVRGRPRKESADTFRTASPAGAYQYLSTSGRDPLPDHDMAAVEPQPQVRAGEPGKDEFLQPATTERETSPVPAVARCTACGGPLIQRARRRARTHCHRCETTHGATA